MGRPRVPLLERFIARLQVRDLDQCWDFSGSALKGGYKQIKVADTLYQAHRVAYAVFNGIDIQDMPRDFFVCHRCDNAGCSNPLHLFGGTVQDNVSDMWSKGRANPSKGATHVNAKISDKDVQAIRRKYAICGYTQRALAEEYNVCQMTVCDIVRLRQRTYTPSVKRIHRVRPIQ